MALFLNFFSGEVLIIIEKVPNKIIEKSVESCKIRKLHMTIGEIVITILHFKCIDSTIIITHIKYARQIMSQNSKL